MASEEKLQMEGDVKMQVNAMTEEFEHIELFGKPVLFTNARVDKATVPEGWYRYNIRGSDYDPGSFGTLEREVAVNHAGTILSPEKIPFPKGRDYIPIRGSQNFLGEELTLAAFCACHGLSIPGNPQKYPVRPASPEEAGLFYAQTPERDEALGTIGQVRMDFGHGGREFWHTWHPRGAQELNSPAFKAELGEVAGQLRESILRDLASMRSYCYDHGGEIEGGTCTQNYGYVVETERYRYLLRCNPIEGDYQADLACFDKQAQKQLIGRVSFASGEQIEYTDPAEYLKAIKKELPYHATSGFRFETLTSDPEVRKAVDDMIYGLYGEEDPRRPKEYEEQPKQGMTMGGMH